MTASFPGAVVETLRRKTTQIAVDAAIWKKEIALRKSGTSGYRAEESDLAKVKVLFDLDPEDWHGCPTESMWAELAVGSEGSRFVLLNSPFYARGISYEDVVEATFIEGSHGVFQFREVVQRSGHSTYMILAKLDEPRLDAYWNLLEKAGCTYEGATLDLGVGRRRLLSVDVPPSADLSDVYDLLERGEHDKVWIFQEGYVYAPNRERPMA